jgi:hypothetical protein
MTYNSFNGIRQYKDGQKCGSDCQGGQSPFGLTCSSSNDMTATHTCMLGAATQDEVATILTLFGPSSSAPPPTVSITSPTANATVAPGFEVDVTCTASDGVASVDLAIDGTPAGTVTSAPFTFKAPASVTAGAHHVVATCTSTGGGTADATVDVTEAASGCQSPSDCPNSTDTCVAGACVPGSDAPGGLGTACTKNAQCTSGECASDGTNQYCVVSCNPAMNGCPSGFGCLAVGTSGVCWPGADSGGGGGGCTTGTGGGEIIFGLGFAGLLLARRRR